MYEVKIDDCIFIPARTIPALTGRLFTAYDTACLLAYPENHMDAELSEPVIPYKLSGASEPCFIHPELLMPVAKDIEVLRDRGATSIEILEKIPADVWVEKSSVLAVAEVIRKSLERRRQMIAGAYESCWGEVDRESVYLPPEEESIILACLSNVETSPVPVTVRKNASSLNLARVDAAVKVLNASLMDAELSPLSNDEAIPAEFVAEALKCMSKNLPSIREVQCHLRKLGFKGNRGRPSGAAKKSPLMNFLMQKIEEHRVT